MLRYPAIVFKQTGRGGLNPRVSRLLSSSWKTHMIFVLKKGINNTLIYQLASLSSLGKSSVSVN